MRGGAGSPDLESHCTSLAARGIDFMIEGDFLDISSSITAPLKLGRLKAINGREQLVPCQQKTSFKTPSLSGNLMLYVCCLECFIAVGRYSSAIQQPQTRISLRLGREPMFFVSLAKVQAGMATCKWKTYFMRINSHGFIIIKSFLQKSLLL